MDPLAAIRDTFFQECEEQLAELAYFDPAAGKYDYKAMPEAEVRAVALGSTDGLKRGVDCVDTGASIAMIRLLHVDMPGEALRARIEANLAGQPSPELCAIHLVRERGDITAAMPHFVAAYLEAQLAT